MIPIDAIIRTRRKSIALIVERDGRLTVRAPLRASERAIRMVVERKAGWIRAKQALAKNSYPYARPKEFIDGEKFWYMGEKYRLAIVDCEKPPLSLNSSFCLSRAARSKAEVVFTGWYRKQARRVISERVQLYAKKYGFSYKQVRISSARTRWGSCSSSGTLSFTWRLVMAPIPVIDYVVIHELLHTQVKNHSKAYWSKLGLILPDYKLKRAWLKVNGPELTLR
jgi:predicted metal-dependent hydrolase